ncbi:MAG: hypothetical protein ABJK28_09415 [Algibacter sp.]
MRNQFLILCFVIFFVNIQAQKIIHNPDHISSNISGELTKVELTDTETILHFHIKSPLGSWISIPKKTYIEDASGKGGKLYITKTDGISLTGKNYMKDSDEIRYKLYFPVLGNDVKKINYGESNPGGNWFIYKLDLSKDGKRFLNTLNKANLNAWKVAIGRNSADTVFINENGTAKEYKIGRPLSFSTSINNPLSYATINSFIGAGENTLLPEEFPKEFFGNWYDKYGTLILITTPDYIVSDSRIQFYQDIQKNGENKFVIKSTRGGFQVLNLDKETITIRTDKLRTLKKKEIKNTVPKSIKGNWLHLGGIKKINVTDTYFYNDDGGVLGVNDIIKSRIDHVVESDSGNVIWFVLYHEGNYNLYIARKTDGEYVLGPRGFAGAKYKKVKN